MPKIDRESIGVAFDLQGCPNRCRHCWLGPASGNTLSEAEVRWGAQLCRQVAEARAFCFERLTIATWFREPDYADQ